MSDEKGSNGLLWFLAGLGIGAAIGVLYAPKSGRETREDLMRYAQDGTDFVKDRARQYKDQAGEWVEKSKEQASQWVERGKEAVNAQRESIRTAFEAGKQAYREAATEPKD